MILCAQGRNVMPCISLSSDEEESTCAYIVHDAIIPSSRKQEIWLVSSASESVTPKLPHCRRTL